MFAARECTHGTTLASLSGCARSMVPASSLWSATYPMAKVWVVTTHPSLNVDVVSEAASSTFLAFKGNAVER